MGCVHTGRGNGRALWAALVGKVNQLLSLLAFYQATLSVLTEDLASLAGAELTARPVPHIAMVTDGALVQAVSLGGSALITALSCPLHFGLALFTSDRKTGVCVTARLALLTHACCAAVLLPLFSVLILFSSRQTWVGYTLWTAVSRSDHLVLKRFADYRLALGHRALLLSVAAHTLGAWTGPPFLSIPIGMTIQGAGCSIAGTLGAALFCRGEGALVSSTAERGAGARAAGHSPQGTHTHGALGTAPLAVMPVNGSFMLTGALGLG